MMKATFYAVSLSVLMLPRFLTGAEEEGTVRTFELGSKLASSVSWSVQDGNGVIQITLPSVRDRLPMPEPPKTQVWLLKADGSATPPGPRQSVGTSMAGFTSSHLIYSFPPKAVNSAVAMAIQIEGAFFVHSLIDDDKAPKLRE